MHAFCWSPLRDAMVQCNSLRDTITSRLAEEGTSACSPRRTKALWSSRRPSRRATGRGQGDRTGHPVGAHPAALPAQPHQRLPDRGRRRLGDPRHRHRQRRDPRACGTRCSAGPLAGRPPHPPDRHALPPRPHRPCGMAVRALRPAPADEPDQLSLLRQHLAEPRRARCQALPRFLPAPRHRRGDDPARRHPGPRLPQDGVGPAADLHPPRRRRPARRSADATSTC